MGGRMNKAIYNVRARALLPILILVAIISCAFNAVAQIRPKSLNEGEVKETRSPPKIIKRPPKASTRASKATNSVLIIQTDPENAEIKIDGNLAGRAADGEFRKELPTGKQYTISISAGPDYEPFEQRVTLRAGRPEIIPAALTSKYGTVKLGPVIEGAKLFIDQKPAGDFEMDKSSGLVIVDKLVPGNHKITYDHPDYVILERDFEVSPGSEYLWTFLPKRATVALTIRTEPGTDVYLDGEPRGETPADGMLKLNDVRIGQHKIKLAKDGFEEYEETRSFEFGKPVEMRHSLVPLPTSTEFNDDFDIVNVNRWTMPASGWTVKSGRLNIEDAPTLGFPTGIRYRDFIAQFHLKLTNAGGAAWAVHAKDSNNYYLFYLSGPNGLFPGRFNTYIVRDNKFDPANFFTSVPVITDLKSGGQYTIEIKVTNNRIEHSIISADTGISDKLGFFEDPNKNFPYGNIGFRTVGAEKFSIDDLFVQPRQ